MNELIIIGGTLSAIGLVFGISALIVWKVDGDISLKRIFNDLNDFINWHLPWSVATWPQIEKHFNLTVAEIAMLEACIQYKILKEYLVYIEAKGVPEKDKLYITLKVSEVRKLVNIRRRNERH